MTFKDVALKNFKFNIKKYSAYFLCSGFCITIFFMYSTILFNNNMMKKIKEFQIDGIVRASCVVIIIFSLFFISYAHSSFIKSRAKELGLFMILGMDKKDIQRLIKVENRAIGCMSILIGLIAGTVFSRLFFMLIIKILDLEKIKYGLNYKNFTYTTLIFVLIFILVELITKIHINKLEISELIKEKRKSQSAKKSKPGAGVLGIILIIISYVFLYLLLNNKTFKNAVQFEFMLPGCILICAVGTYLAISEFGALLIESSKKNKNRYYNSILSVSQINYKFKQYRKILFVVSMLSAGVVFCIGLAYGMYATTLDDINANQPYDIMYVQKGNYNKLSDGEINEIIKKSDEILKDKKSLEFIEMNLMRKESNNRYELWSNNQMVLCDEKLSEFLGRNVDVEKGHTKLARFSNGKETFTKKGNIIKLTGNKDKKNYDFIFDDEINETVINKCNCKDYSTYFPIILDKEDYDNLVKSYYAQGVSIAHVFSFDNWKNTEKVHETLTEKLKSVNNFAHLNENDKQIKEWKKGIVSKYNEYKITLKKTGFFFFVMCFMGGLFFISIGVVLYFKVYSDIDEGKVRYNQLLKIGITDKEMQNVFSKELRPIFFIPITLGSTAGFVYVSIMSRNISFYGKLLISCAIVIGIYFILQTIFYLITKNKFIKEIIN